MLWDKMIKLIALLLILYWLLSPKISVEFNQPIQEIEETQETGSCSLSLNKYQVETGDLVKGEIITEPNTECDVYYKAPDLFIKNWKFAVTSEAGDNGKISYEDEILIPGTYHLLAICKTNPNCKTNEEILTVKL